MEQHEIITSYFALPDARSAAAVARDVKVSPSVLYQWKKGLRPVPTDYGAALERATGGAVPRRRMWPDTWAAIWPELAQQSQPAEAPHA